MKAPEQIFKITDVVAERIDELTDLCELWKKRREEGRPATYLRRAIIDLGREITTIVDAKPPSLGLPPISPEEIAFMRQTK